MNFVITIFAAICILFLPGFVWSFVFFAKKSIDYIERLVLSFTLSIALVPLVVFYTNLIGIRVTMLTVIMQVILVILIALAIIIFKEIKKRK